MATEKPYMEPVARILRDLEPGAVLDMPSGSGWLRERLPPGTAIDGVDLYAPAPAGYRAFRAADLDGGIPDGFGPYNAIVSCEGIEHVGNPLALLKSAARQLSPGGTMVLTTPNIWYPEARLKFLLRGFFPGFPSLVGAIAPGAHMHVTPWSFPWLHLYLTLAGFSEITLHDLGDPKPRHAWERIFGSLQKRYCRRKARAAASDDERAYWEACGADPSVYGRRLVVSASLPG